MEEWDVMFAEANQILQSAQTLEEAIAQTVASARRYPKIFDEPDYWNRVEQHDFRQSFGFVTEWAREGLSYLPEYPNSEHLILDMGDCPEIFSLRLPSRTNKFEDYDPDAVELCHASMRSLCDEVFAWGDDDSTVHFHGDNGYFLWLVFGSFALVTMLRDRLFRQICLRSREGIEIHSGFEGLYFPLARVTLAGVTHSIPAPINTIEWQTEKTGQLEFELLD